MKKNRILFIMHTPPPVHGASMVGLSIKESPKINETFECKYINPSASQTVSEVGNVSFRKIIFLIRNLLSIIKCCISFNPSLVYFTPTSDGWGIIRDAITIGCIKLTGKKIILHLHNKGCASFSKKHKWSIPFYKIMYTNNKLILLSPKLYPDLKEFVKEENVYYCPNGIKCQCNFPHQTHEGPIRFLYLSNMIESKGPLVLLEACKLLKEEGKDFYCDYVGNWGDITEDKFKSEINKRNLQNNIQYHGPQYGENKWKFMQQADIFVFPTYFSNECFPLVLLEAMQASLPCISTNNGGIEDIIIKKETGLIVKQKDATSLYKALSWSIENKDKLYEMGVKGHQHLLQNFTYEIFIDRLCNILQENV